MCSRPSSDRAVLFLLPLLTIAPGCGFGSAGLISSLDDSAPATTVVVDPPTLEFEEVTRYTLSPVEIQVSTEGTFERVDLSLFYREGSSGEFLPATLVDIATIDELVTAAASPGGEPLTDSGFHFPNGAAIVDDEGTPLLHPDSSGAAKVFAQPLTLTPEDFAADDAEWAFSFIGNIEGTNEPNEYAVFWDFQTDLGDGTLRSDVELRVEFQFVASGLFFNGVAESSIPALGNSPLLGFAEYFGTGQDFVVVFSDAVVTEPPAEGISAVATFALAVDDPPVNARQWFSFRPSFHWTDGDGVEQEQALGTDLGGSSLLRPDEFTNPIPTSTGGLIGVNSFVSPWIWDTRILFPNEDVSGTIRFEFVEAPVPHIPENADPGGAVIEFPLQINNAD